MIPAPHRYRDGRVPTDLRRLISVAAPSLVVAAWRWRYEIALGVGTGGRSCRCDQLVRALCRQSLQ